MPDFDIMAQLLVMRYACSVTSIEKGIAEELKAMFNQGYTLGYRDAVESQKEMGEMLNTQDMWYDAIDGDDKEQDRLKEINESVVQKKDKASGCYVARYVNTGIEVGRRCGGKPFENIRIEE